MVRRPAPLDAWRRPPPVSRPDLERSLAVVLVAALLAVVGTACGADAVDRSRESEVLVDTCRSMVERSSGLSDVVIEREELEAFLATEPGNEDDRAVAKEMRQRCVELAVQLRSESGP